MIEREVLELAQELIRRPSVSPDDQGCQDLIATMLTDAGFHVERLNFGETSNLFARTGSGPIRLMLNGHTDVVPPGDGWSKDPYSGLLEGRLLHGRGSSDMKSGVAAMVVALIERARNGRSDGLALLLTSDEEASGEDGTKRALQALLDQGHEIRNAFVAEPTSVEDFGDTYKPGRRGSVTVKIVAKGEQGHVAYLPSHRNVAHTLALVLSDLQMLDWDSEPMEEFPSTQMHVVRLEAGLAENVVPGEASAVLNWRNSPAATPERLRELVEAALAERLVEADLEWTISAQPFLTPAGPLTAAVEEAVAAVTGHRPAASTGGGTSDARWFAAHGIPVAEFGVVPIRMHGVNECVQADDVVRLVQVIEDLCLRTM